MNNMPERGNKKRVAIAICVFIIGLLIIVMPLLWNWLVSTGIICGIIITSIGMFLYLSKSMKMGNKKIAAICIFIIGLLVIMLPILWNSLLWIGLLCGIFIAIIGIYLYLPRREKKLREELQHENVAKAIEDLLEKESNFFMDDVQNCLSKNDIASAERLLKEKKQLYERFLELRKIMKDVDDKTTKLSSRLAESELSPDTYELAMDELKRKKHDIDEEMWGIQRKIFREKYEKPF